MIDIIQSKIANRLLRRLPERAFDLLAPHLRMIDLPVKRSLVRPQKAIESVCFLESGLASVVGESEDGKCVEVRHVGYEGVTGHPVIQGVDRTPSHTFMQVAGHGIQVRVRHLMATMDDRNTQWLLLRYVHTCELQLSYSALAAAKYKLHQRLARWLLMCHDRVRNDELPLTHEFLALMLGVRRSGVTDELHILEGLHVIKSVRGAVHIRDRAGLIEIAGGCYGVPEKEYERLIGGSGSLQWVPDIPLRAQSQPQTAQ
jgi:CRP-like cAMP-binding protein